MAYFRHVYAFAAVLLSIILLLLSDTSAFAQFRTPETLYKDISLRIEQSVSRSSASSIIVTGIVPRGANIYQGPGMSFSVVGDVPINQAVAISGRNRSGTWIQLRDGGWIETTLLENINGNINALSIASDVEEATQAIEVSANNSPVDHVTEYGPDRQAAYVVNVVDGDTIEVQIEGQSFRVRYIGIDTPEYNQPFGPEASRANSLLVGNQTVYMERDVSNTDQYGRLLRYVYLGNGTFINQELVRQGVAEAVAYPPDTRHQSLFEDAQIQASQTGIGIWGQSQLIPTGPSVNRTANLRTGPGTNYEIVGQVIADQEVVITGRTQAGGWYQLKNDYWIAAFLIDNAPTELLVVAPPPLPPAQTAEPPEVKVNSEAPLESRLLPGNGTHQVIIQSVFYDGVVRRVESDEYAVIANIGTASTNLSGWRLNAGDNGQDFYFPTFELSPGMSIRVYTNEHHPQSGGFSFGSGKAIWNNKGDCGQLFDTSGVQVAEFCY